MDLTFKMWPVTRPMMTSHRPRHTRCYVQAGTCDVRSVRQVSKASPFVFGNKVIFKCEFCPYKLECSSRNIASGVRRHCTNHQGGRGLPGSIAVDLAAFVKLKAGAQADWKCPYCRFGLPLGTKVMSISGANSSQIATGST